ncbi:zinc-dependent metalloprotease [Chitinophagaceae bacterium LB-8]|uniref:Zinc-dependent metalloprotease n=1 Tax=Paraflavisolibacter caeni TaxID=2982496 RepID=A0A9X2XZC9_9BACT|nr:zinc-dependent metalloprotease [Paraflavisolibacter caeni]MCU7551667.1 zinc-dependent metalloprotease [Paraflavisolibacter caeni]
MTTKPLFLLVTSLFISALCFGQAKGKNKDRKVTVTQVPAVIIIDSSKLKKPVLSITDKVKSSKKSDGLFTIYQDTATGTVQLYIKKDQLGKEYIYQSFSINGPTSLYLNQSMHRSNFVFKVQKAFDKLEFSRVNTSFYYDPQNPVSKSKDVDKPDAIFLVEKVSAEDSTGYLINADNLFISEKLDPIKPVTPPSFFSVASFNLGSLNPSKSKYHAIKSFPQNTDVVVDLAYDNPGAYVSGGSDITDPRYVRVTIQHSFIEMPKNDFKPRRDDPRIGYFSQQVTDQTSISPVPYKDIINRWNLKKKDPNAAISEPVEPIVFWIENTTPVEYRQAIMEAGLKWNAAFEKAGFKNAIQMKIMPDDADWDPADIRYNVIRWVSSANPPYGAIGPSFVNPQTGQILGADITVEWYAGSATPIIDELLNGGKVIGLNFPGMNTEQLANCTLASELKSQLMTGMTALEIADASPKELREMHREFLTYLIMHEMGHTLGLNHNMKASQMWSRKEINNKELTRQYGLTGSVMDYPAVNIALDKKLQGDYYTTLAGPYDEWAIEYGYTEFKPGEEEAGLKDILSRSTDPKLIFGNDGDDMRSPGKAIDPRVNVNDLTSDAIGYAEDRLKLVNSLMGKLVTKYSKPGQSYAELRARYNSLQTQRFNMIAAVSRYIGGVYVDRSFPDQKSGKKPFTPVSLADQKRAVTILSKYVFAPNAFAADAPVFAYLQLQRRGFSQPQNGEDYKVTNTVLNQQLNGALAHIMHPNTLGRITNSRFYGNQYSTADVMNDLTQAIFTADLKSNVNIYRQNLQTNYVKGLISIMEDKFQYDDIAKAAALHSLKKIKAQLAIAVSPNEETKAHRESLGFLISSALEPK